MIKRTVQQIRAFLLCEPRGEFLRVSVEGKLLYVGVSGQTWARIATTVHALGPERIDVMVREAEGLIRAHDGIVLRSAEVAAKPVSVRLSKRIGAFEERLTELERLHRDREKEVRTALDTRLAELARHTEEGRRELETARRALQRATRLIPQPKERKGKGNERKGHSKAAPTVARPRQPSRKTHR